MDSIELDPNEVVAGLLEQVSRLTLETVQLRVVLNARDRELAELRPTHTLRQVEAG